MDIPVMADGGDNGHGAGGDGHSELIVVKAGQVQFGTAAAQNQDGVIILFSGIQKGRHDGSRSLFSLHEGLQKVQTENIPFGIVQQMVPEIPIPGGRLGRDDGQAVRDLRQRQFLLQLHVTAGGEPLDGALAFQRLLPQGESRVYIVYEQRDAVQFAETNLDPYQDGNARLERLPGLFFEETLDGGIVPLPDHGPGFGNRPAAPGLGE